MGKEVIKAFINSYEELARNKDIIKEIDKEFFFEITGSLINYIQQLENKVKEQEELDFTTVYINGYHDGEAKNAYKKQRLKELEQREEKIKDKLEEDIKIYDDLRKKHDMYSSSEERCNTKYHYAMQILNLLEGENNAD